ncbi:MAG: amidohydrolase family protein [Halieaceae bacterium]
MSYRRVLASVLLAVFSVACTEKSPDKSAVYADDAVRVYLARSIVTMDAIRPRADAVAVADGRIVGVGNLFEIERNLGDRDYLVDKTFADKVLMPGFIEPHLHPYIAGILLPMEFITPHDWQLAGREVKAVRGRAAYLARVRAHESTLAGDEWLWTWGYHPLFHGPLSRVDLDAISPRRPAVVWHRSFHEIYLNTAALKALQIDEAAAAAHPQVDLANGHFYENGLELLLPRMTPLLLEPTRYVDALREARKIIHAGGITTVGDGAFGTLNLELEIDALKAAGWDTWVTPFRTFLLLDGKALGEAKGHEQVVKIVNFMKRRDMKRIRFSQRQIKLFADGAAYSQLMQMSEAYTDGHEGEWLMQPDELLAAARVYWNAGFQIHVHVNGDAGLDTTLDVLQSLQQENPREDHRFTIHHLAYARPDQAQRLAELGGMVQANPYYLWALADVYAESGLGFKRASNMVPLNSFAKAGTRVALHSDFTMAPAQPLLLAWAATTRRTAEGNVFALNERLTLQEALRGITIDAAYQLQQESEIGSIEVGKQANLTVLEQDPFEVPLDELKDIPIWGTMFEGRVYPLSAE